MRIAIKEYELPVYSHKLYDVLLDDDEIKTLVTYDLNMVTAWLINAETIHRCRLNRLIVGLDIEWRPNFGPNDVQNPVATLQLCIGKNCLIFQIIHAADIPFRLAEFLGNYCYTFVGVGIEQDARKLWNDYGLTVAKTIDLRTWAADELDNEGLRRMGLKELAREILGVEMEKPLHVRVSDWDEQLLMGDQVTYACLDAYFSFEIGRRLSAWY